MFTDADLNLPVNMVFPYPLTPPHSRRALLHASSTSAPPTPAPPSRCSSALLNNNSPLPSIPGTPLPWFLSTPPATPGILTPIALRFGGTPSPVTVAKEITVAEEVTPSGSEEDDTSHIRLRGRGGNSRHCHSCHHTFARLAICTHVHERGTGSLEQCRLAFCTKCIAKWCPDNEQPSTPSSAWQCPRCTGRCGCSSCKRNREKKRARVEQGDEPGARRLIL